MPAQLFYVPFDPVFTSRGLPAGAAQAFFYYTGTTTLAPIYSDGALSIRHDNPIRADNLGRLPSIYLDDTITYRVRILDGTGAQIGADADPYIPGNERAGPPGAADNTYTTRALLRASDTSRKTASLVGDNFAPDGRFNYETGDGPYVDDDGVTILVPSGDTNGAWVRQRASGLSFKQNATSARIRVLEDWAREKEKSPDDFLGTDIQKLQAALNVGGLISLSRTYTMAEAATMRGNTQLVGKPGSKLVWAGPTTGNILQDSSVLNPGDINQNITLDGFEIDGGSVTTGDAAQRAIYFYRVGNVTIRGCKIHGVGGSGIHYGGSMLDTVGVLVENNDVYDCRQGDAIQGVGRAIVIRNNRIGKLGSTTANFGDTGIALLYDFSSTTNPNGIYSTDWEFSGNTIIGNYNLAGSYVGTGQPIQTGIAVGPFQIGVNTNGRILNNVVFGCYLNLWAIVFDNLLVEGNDFGSHAATATGNIRFDGVTNLRARGNTITLRLSGTGPDYAGVLLVAQRNIFGGSTFDADVARFEVSGNTISSIQAGVQGIRATFETVATSPTYISKLTGGRFEANTFVNIPTPVSLAPQAGSNPSVCSDVIVRGNKTDAIAQRVVMAGGVATQYANTRLRDNPTPGVVPPASGTGAAGLRWSHAATGTVTAAGSGTPVDLVTLPSGNYTVQAAARVPNQNNATLSATAMIHINGTSARISADNGAAMALALNGLTLRATQSVGSSADITFDLQYTL